MERTTIYITGINPEPWTAGTVALGFKGGKKYPMVSKDARLRDYQEAIKESIRDGYPELKMVNPDARLRLEMMFWRQLDTYTGGTGRKQSRNVADATNMTKATEDALQGVLFKNDRMVKHSSGEIMEEGPDVEPRILIVCTLHTPSPEWKRYAHALDSKFSLGIAERPFPGNVWIEPSRGEL